MNIVFVACVEIGHICLEGLLEKNWKMKGLITLKKEKSAHTSGYVDFSPLCQKNDIEMMEVWNINSPETIEKVKTWNVDVIIVCGWQRLLKNEILGLPAWGVIGVHSSLLPKYRGRAPVNWAMIEGEKETGVTVFKMDVGADTGYIIGQEKFPILPFDTCRDIYRKSANATSVIVSETLKKIENNTIDLKENQSGQHPCMVKRTPEDGRIDWKRSALDLHDWVRALTHPYPGAFTEKGGKKIFLWESIPLHPGLPFLLQPGECTLVKGLGAVFGCGKGALLVTKLQIEGKEEVPPDQESELKGLYHGCP